MYTMRTSKKPAPYQSISLSKQFIAEINKHIQNDPKYRSVADFTRQAIREKMDRDNKKGKKEFLEKWFTTQDGKPDYDIRDMRILQLQESVNELITIVNELKNKK